MLLGLSVFIQIKDSHLLKKCHAVRRAGLLLVSGQVLLGVGDDSAGRLRLTKALTHAHKQLGNTQVVVQVGAPFPAIDAFHQGLDERVSV